MQKGLPDNLLSLYEQTIKSSLENFRKSDHNTSRSNDYQYYCSLSNTELNAINTTQLQAECLSIENQVNARVKQLSQIKQRLTDSSLTSKSISVHLNTSMSNCQGAATNSKAFSEQYSKDIQSITTQLNDLLIKIDSLSNSPFDSMKKAKSEYDNKSEFILQPLINSMLEKRKYYSLVIKEKDSKLKIVEEKKTTLSENRMKIERLTKEFNENSEKMTNELKQNDAIQKELEHLIASKNINQSVPTSLCIPEDQLNIIFSMKKKQQIAMMNISDKLSMIDHYHKTLNRLSRRFIFIVLKIAVLVLTRKQHTALQNEYADTLIKSKKENEALIKDYTELGPICLEALATEEQQQHKLNSINKRIAKLESIVASMQ